MRSGTGLRGRRRTPTSGPIREQHPGHVIKPGPMRSLITPVNSVSPASVRMVVTSVPVFRAKTRYIIIIIIIILDLMAVLKRTNRTQGTQTYLLPNLLYIYIDIGILDLGSD